MNNQHRPLVMALGLAVLAAGCSGNRALPGLGQSPQAQSPQAQSASPLAPARHKGKVKATMHVLIPRARKHGTARQLRPYFVATSTLGIEVEVYAHGSDTTPLGKVAVSVAPSSPLCQAVAGGRSCTIEAPAPVGNDDFVVTTYDAAPVGGSFSGAKELAIGATTQTISLAHKNSFGVTIGGIVAKGAVQLATASVPVIENNTQTVTFSALDADGNTIINDGWYDANGNAVTMAVDATGQGSATIAFVPTTVSFAAPTSSMTYTSSTASSSQIQDGITATVWANPSNLATSGAATFTLAAPAFTEFPISTPMSYPEGITVGPDNNIWFAESNANKIGTIATNAAPGTMTTDYGGLTSGATPTNLASAGGQIWFTEFGIGKIGSIDPSSPHTVAEYATPSCGTPCTTPDNPYGIIKGPDGNLWFTENCTTHSNIGRFGPTLPTVMKEYATSTAGAAPGWITVGPDNNLWFTEPGGGSLNKIGTMTNAVTPIASDFPVSPSGTIYSGGITSADGALWFAECNPPGNAMRSITTSGSVSSSYPLHTMNSSPLGVTTGPDGAVWFAENGNNAIGRIDPKTQAIVEFSLPHAGSNPWGITLGPDGALWFTECFPTTGNRIGRLQ